MQEYLNRAEKIMDRLNQLAAISEDQTGITRTYCSPAFMEGRNLVQRWMEAAGLKVCTDAIGNLRGRLESTSGTRKTFVIASHIDTVVNAGKFDGPLGVVLGLDLLENLKASQTELPFNLELIAFADEEGCRFHTTYLGSKAVAGSFDSATLAVKDAAGITLKEALISMDSDPDNLGSCAIEAEDWLGYFEVHIEQGPVLYEQDIPVAVVTAIAGQNRSEITFNGMAGHAGTVPMDMRRDALCSAAECILDIEQYALSQKTEIVATVGKLNITNAASNVIPGAVTCTLDLRSADEARLLLANEALQKRCREICEKRNIQLQWKPVQFTPPVACSDKLNEQLTAAIEKAGYPVIKLVSGAGHDAVPISKVAPATMLFVRCFEGISHNPLENAELKDIAAAVKVSENFIKQLVKESSLQQHIGIP